MKRPDGRTTVAMCLALLFLTLPVIYVLSIGPAAGMYARGLLPGEAYFALYQPFIEFVYKPERESLQDILNWYCQLWLPNS